MTRRLGSWLLDERLGRGGMGEVWRARGDGDRAVVIKRLHDHLADDAQFRRMFAAEARVIAGLEHANIARFVELGDAGGELFLVMEEVAGVDLGTLQRAHARPLPVGAALQIARDVARALAYAHARGVIHRDVTPSNVMIGFDGSTRLIDFGIAKAVAEIADPKTKTGVLKGKVGYMAPEQLRPGESIDARVDIYATGVLLHEMLCGRRLFKAESDARVMDLVLQANVRPPSAIAASVPADIDAMCLRALAPDRDARTAHAGELADALDAALARTGWDGAATGALAASAAPHRETTREQPPTNPSPRTVTEAQPPRPRRRARWWAIAGAGALLSGGALVATMRARAHRMLPAVAAPVVAAPIVLPSAPAPAPMAPTPAAAPTHHKRKPKRAPDIERGDVVDPFHRK